MYPVPEKFAQTIRGVHGEKGSLWLQQLDRLLLYCEETWSLKILEPYPLSFNYVAPVIFKNGTEAVLKLGVPGKEFITERAALELYNGNGMARLIDADTESGILLIERLKPGKTLKSVENDEEATLIAAKVIRNLACPAPQNAPFPSVAQWAQGLDRLRKHYKGETGPIPENMVTQAERFYKTLFATPKELQLLHGDLHHENILSAEREPWLAIDPKGLIGEPEYGVIQFLMNNLPAEQPRQIIKRRVELFVSELNLDRERVLAWAYSHAVLSAWWCIEDGTDGAESSIQTATVFEALLKAA